MNQNISHSLGKLPELLSSQHLVQLGLYPTIAACYQDRAKGYSPEYIKLRRKILYPKKAVIEFLESRVKLGDSCNQSTNQQLGKTTEKE